MKHHRNQNLKSQNGAVLLLLMFAVIIGFSSLFIIAYNNNKLDISNDKETSEALSKAKQAVLDYVTANYHLYETGEYGFLPCPDTSSGSGLADGIEHSGCFSANRNIIGHLPWQSLGISPLKDSTGRCLWFAATSLEKTANPEDLGTGMISLYSSDRNTEISNPTDPFVALIIAPKSSFDYQVRTGTGQNTICEQSFDATDYLDSTQLTSGTQVNNAQVAANPSSPDIFITSGKQSQNTLPPYSQTNPQPFNDQIIYISRDELIAAINASGNATSNPSANEADLDESTAQITFANNLSQFNIKRESAAYTSTSAGEDSELLLHSDINIAQAQQHICLWYDGALELENKILRSFFKIKFQDDTTNDSLGRCSGLTFAITPGPATTCGNGGSDLGFAGMPGPLGNRSFAVEYDISPSNSKNDPAENHIAVVTRSNNSHNSGANTICPSTGCNGIGSATQDEITWMEDTNEHSTRIEIQTGYTSDQCSDGDEGNGGDYTKVTAWVNCTGSTCTNLGKLDANYSEVANLPIVSHCIDFPSQMNGNPDDGDNGIRFGFTAAIGGCNAGPVSTDITISEFGLTIE